MRVLIDMCHPAHVHFFKNFIRAFKEKGNEVFIVARDKDVSYKLLDRYDLSYINISRHYDSIIAKYYSGVLNIFKFIIICKKNRIDFVIDSGASVYSNIASLILRIPNISFNNTEVFSLLKIVKLFSSYIITPSNYLKDFGKKHIRINSYFELAFLHRNVFKSDQSIYQKLGLKKNEKYILLRFVNWYAAEEKNQLGVTINDIQDIVSNFSKNFRVFISCEFDLPDELELLQIEKNHNIRIGDMQNIEANATLFFGTNKTPFLNTILPRRTCPFISSVKGVFWFSA